MKGLNWYQAFLEIVFGVEFRYYVNHGTKEIHDLNSDNSFCRLSMITNGSYSTKRKADKLMRQGYNGCRLCLKNEDKG